MPIFGCASDEQFYSELNETIDVEKKCDYCNCAIRDCSLCGVSQFDEFDDNTPIC